MIISLVSQKGGVGKTTSTQNLASALVNEGKKVLMVDLDPQGSLGVAEGIKLSKLDYSMADVMLDEVEMEEIILETNNIDLAPSRIDLSQAEINLISEVAREMTLKSKLHNIKDDYDFILIDCPPSLSLLTINALTASDEIIVPVSSDFLSIMALDLLLETVDKIQTKINPELSIFGILATMFDSRTTHSKKAIESLEERFKGKYPIYKIARSVKVKDSLLEMKSFLEVDKKHKISQAYLKVARDLIKEEEK